MKIDDRPRASRVDDARTRAALAVAAAAPRAAAAPAPSASAGSPAGLISTSATGRRCIFGDSGTPPASGPRPPGCCAEESAAGATYLDLRVPGRVAAGGVGPVAAGADPPEVDPQP